MEDHSLSFDPVPGRARHDGWTPERQRAFIRALDAGGTVAGAARLVGMSPKSAYALRRRAGDDSGFARCWDAALERAYQAALADALPLAIEGEERPIFYRSRQVGVRRRPDNRLLFAILRAQAARARPTPGGW